MGEDAINERLVHATNGAVIGNKMWGEETFVDAREI